MSTHHHVSHSPARDIKLAPCIRGLPDFDEDAADFLQMVKDVKAGDPFPPGYVGPEGLVAGRRRRRAHEIAGRDFPYFVIGAELASLVAMKENTNRSDHTKEQLAFMFAPLIREVVEKAEKRKQANLTNVSRQSIELTHEGPSTLAELSDEININRTTVSNAAMTHAELVKWDAAHEPKRWGESKVKQSAMEYFSARILDRENPMHLGAVRAGLAGRQATAEKPRNEKSPARKIVAPAVTIATQLGELGPIRDLEEAERKEFRDELSSAFLDEKEWTAKQCESAAACCHELGAEFKRLAKKAGKTAEASN